MLPFSIGFAELVVIFTVLLLVVGPKGIPQLARTVGGWVRMARRTMRELQDVVLDADVKAPLVKPWEEVVKARDKAIESVLSLNEDVIEAEIQPNTSQPDVQNGADSVDAPSESATELFKARETAVQARSSVQRSTQGASVEQARESDDS